MDITEHYRELGLQAGASHEEIARAYRRRMLLLTDEGNTVGASNIDRGEYSAAVAFLALSRITAKGIKKGGGHAETKDASLWQQSEVFRFQRTPVRKTVFDFSPAKRPTIPSSLIADKPRPVHQDEPQSPFISTLVISGAAALTLAFVLNFTTEEHPVIAPQAQATPPTEGNRPKADRVEASIAATPASVPPGRIVVRANRPNVRLALKPPDGSPTLTNERPDENFSEFIDLPAGDYHLTAHLDGWIPITRTVRVFPGIEVETLLEFSSGSLRLESDPSGAVVFSGNKVLGRTPLLLNDLPPSSQTFSLKYDWWPESRITRTIQAGTELKVSVRFSRGRLSVGSSPVGAMLLIDGKEFGKTPVTVDQIPAGLRKVSLRAEEYHPLEVSVNVSDGADFKISPTLSSALVRLVPNDIINASWKDAQPARNQQDSTAAQFTAPKNGVIKNLDRRTLDMLSLGRKFRFGAAIKSYDPKSGRLEFVEEDALKSRYRVVAQLSSSTQSDQAFTNRLHRGSVIEIRGILSAVEEPRWPAKTITLEIDQASPIN